MQQREAQRQAPLAQAEYQRLRLERIRASGRLSDWKMAAQRLSGPYTREEAAASSHRAGLRLKYLAVPEPEPALEDFTPDAVIPVDAVTALAEMRRRFEADRVAHPEREKARLKELEYARTLYEQLLEREQAARLRGQRDIWASRGVTLDPDIASIDGIESQVRAQNAKIERQVRELSELLTEGLDALPATHIAPTSERPDNDPPDPAGVVLGVETALTTMQIGPDFDPRVRAAYSAESRQAVIEYELPDVNVVPKAKVYRYVKSRNEVTEAARPQAQVKSLYAGAIAQLTLLCLANVFASDGQGAVDVAVFNGMVDTLDPRSGQPVRPWPHHRQGHQGHLRRHQLGARRPTSVLEAPVRGGFEESD
jgi:hypothetical protein